MPGLVDGHLAPPPASPNCVSSETSPQDRVHYVAALPVRGDADTAISRLAALIAATPRTRVVVQGGDYLHAVYTTRLLRFHDDLELRLDRVAGVVHVRSASRVGRGDLGANRARVEELRRRWLAS